MDPAYPEVPLRAHDDGAVDGAHEGHLGHRQQERRRGEEHPLERQSDAMCRASPHTIYYLVEGGGLVSTVLMCTFLCGL